MGYNEEYYKQNREKIIQQKREYNRKNKELIAMKMREYRKNNPEKVKETQRKARASHLEYMKQYNKDYYLRQKEKLLADNKKYRQGHRERLNAKKKEWVKNNPEKRAMYSHNYQSNHPEDALQRQIRYLTKVGKENNMDYYETKLALHTWSRAVKKRDNNKCVRCGSISKLEAHHIKHKKNEPQLAFDVSNGETLCDQCHYREHGKLSDK